MVRIQLTREMQRGIDIYVVLLGGRICGDQPIFQMGIFSSQTNKQAPTIEIHFQSAIERMEHTQMGEITRTFDVWHELRSISIREMVILFCPQMLQFIAKCKFRLFGELMQSIQLSDSIVSYLSQADYRCEQAFNYDEALMRRKQFTATNILRSGALTIDLLAKKVRVPQKDLDLTKSEYELLTEHFYAEDMIDIIRAVKHGQEIPPIDFREDLVAGMMLQFLLIFVTICLSLFVTLRFATKRLWAPFDDTLQKVERFNLAQSEVPCFSQTDIQEFARLNQSLATLMANDKGAYRIQKEFTENASHELHIEEPPHKCPASFHSRQ